MSCLSAAEQRALAHLDTAELVRWTRELVRIPSVYRPDQEATEEQAARWVEVRLQDIELEVYREEAAPRRPNVIGILKGIDDQRTLMFEGHTDVVTEGDPKQWTHGKPFSATLKDGKIYGRGANDMKGGLVAAICATKAIAESGLHLNGDILIGAVADEEGQMLGIKHFVKQGWADRVDAAIICEPEANRLCITQKGVMWIRLTLTGVMAHGAMPLTGTNTIYPAAVLLGKIRQLEAHQIKTFGNDEWLGQPSITPTIVQAPQPGSGEPQRNVMPGDCVIILDLRLLPGQVPEQLANQIRALAAEVAAVERMTITTEVLEIRPPTHTPHQARIVQILASAYRDLTGKPETYGGVPGSTDGTILHWKAGVPVVICGPGDIHIPHHYDEWLDIDQLIEAARLYVVTALRFLEVA